MSLQLKIIIAVTKLINVKKIFTLEGQALQNEVLKKQKKIEKPKNNSFQGFEKAVLMVNDHKLYKFSKVTNKKALLYLPGGGFVLPISGLHWDYLSDLSQHVDADIFVGIYPLAPIFNADDVFAFIRESVRKMKAMGYQEITIMGDSAGGNIALAVVQLAEIKKAIDKVIAISPLVDFALTNPVIIDVEKKDTIVATKALNEIRSWYASNYLVDSPLISPIYGDFDDIKVFMVSGTRDVTNPDTNRMAQMHGEIDYLEFSGLPHVFALYPIPEAGVVNKRVWKFINE
ncbi:alpha/beta hydrolase [Listeria seeligeri]|uniref:alpha/beta hydrolase fold domain-containing protein n=1 Tax=Listeria seeligeri TaxID=1640 RepID=UPI00194247AE|nr:alpha/beta hydrolase [Listeria seeligeri]MBM5696250.1 alpha/beta hydrolase [Listeria seeligeri]